MRVATVTKLAVLAFAALLVVPPLAAAVLPGANGRIAYISGRGVTDAQAKLYLRVAVGSFGAGLNSGPVGSSAGQHRHPTWSPDRTKIAYALGDASCNPTKCDIVVLDLTAPFPLPEKVTNTPTVNEDRPAWSPDGTRIAYESEVTNGSGQVDILVDPVGAGATLNLTSTAGTIEGKPAWTPDSTEIYYHTGNPALENSLDIVKEPAGGGAVTGIATSGGENEFQPSLSPDGKQLCFTRGTGAAFGGGAATTDVIVSLANGGGQQDLSDDNVEGNYNCTWSPNGTQVAYVDGIFSTGNLVMERADDTSPFPIELEASAGTFDGNPDWAPDGRPACEPAAAATAAGQPVTIELTCLDTGPFYERSQVQEFISGGPPANGTLGPIAQGDQGPSTVLYTPNPGFAGTDSFQFSSFDQIAGFAEAPVTATIQVAAAPAAPGAGDGADDPAPVLSNLKVTPPRWRLGGRLPQISAAPVGAKIRWTLSEVAPTRLVFQRALPGRRVGGRCIRQTPANATKKRCTRFGNAGALNVAAAHQGRNTVAFQGRIPGKRKKLAPGRYRVSAQARDGAGQASNEGVSPPFTIVAR